MRPIETCVFSGHDGATKVVSVPIDYDCGEQIEASHTVVLSLGGSVTDFALTPDAQSVFQGMMCLAFVQANLSAPLHVSIKQPIYNEERALDAADFPKGYSQVVLTGIGRKLSQELAGWHDACDHGGRTS